MGVALLEDPVSVGIATGATVLAVILSVFSVSCRTHDNVIELTSFVMLGGPGP